jgi:hypothetical protein
VGIDAPELILLIIVDERPIKEFDLASDNFFKLDCAAKSESRLFGCLLLYLVKGIDKGVFRLKSFRMA